jgi:hypothetical protein
MRNKRTFYNILGCILADLVRECRQPLTHVAKINGLFYYVRAIRVVRSVYIRLFLIILSFTVMINGLIFLHVSFFYYFPFSREVKALIVLLLGIFYFMVPVGALLFFTSQRVWMKFSKSNELIRKVMGEIESRQERN